MNVRTCEYSASYLFSSLGRPISMLVPNDVPVNGEVVEVDEARLVRVPVADEWEVPEARFVREPLLEVLPWLAEYTD